MSNTEYFEFAKDFFEKCLDISRKKNADYTGRSENPFANFEAVETLHINTAQGFVTRMTDKMMRIASFVKNGELQVKDESVSDTLNDLANYCCLFAGWIESKKNTESNSDKGVLKPFVMDAIKLYSPNGYGGGSYSFPTSFLQDVLDNHYPQTARTIGWVNSILLSFIE